MIKYICKEVLSDVLILIASNVSVVFIKKVTSDIEIEISIGAMIMSIIYYWLGCSTFRDGISIEKGM